MIVREKLGFGKLLGRRRSGGRRFDFYIRGVKRKKRKWRWRGCGSEKGVIAKGVERVQ